MATSSSLRLVKAPLTDIAHRIATIVDTPKGSDLGISRTDRLFLIGHADGIELNSPMQVVNLQEIVTYLGGDTDSPLLRAVFDAYNEGARDIWIVAAAPMSEYISDLSNRNTQLASLGNKSFYELYYSRLTTTYSVLREYSEPEVIVPIEAPFYYTASVDFLTQLADHCSDAFSNTGRIRLGIIGTRIDVHTTTEVTDMANDVRLTSVKNSPGGKFVMIAGGETTVNHPQLPIAYDLSASIPIAARICILKPNIGILHREISTVIAPSSGEYSDASYSQLALSGINWVTRSKLGKRGVPYQTYLGTDNVLSGDSDSIWSLAHVRVLSKVVNAIQEMGSMRIGSVEYPSFKREVIDYMELLKNNRMLKGYTLNIHRSEYDVHTVIVDVNIRLFGSLREIFMSVSVGNSATVR